MTFQAAIFDLDGTLVDSEALALKAGQRAAARFGLPLEPAFYHSLIGTDYAVTQARLVAEFGAEMLPKLEAAWDAEYEALKSDELQAKPRAHDLLTHLGTQGTACAVATSSRHSNAHRSLRISGFAGFFKTVVTRDCVAQAKPHPEPYLTAAARLGVAPEDCIAFEDSRTGALAAMAAGMTVIVVPDIAPVPVEIGHHRAETLWHGAELAGLIR